ncbi:MAG: ATP-binding cassette domain-containing protein [Bacteroidota bacterium]
MTPVLVLDNVTKKYGQTVAVDGVSFRAEPGRLFGLLGPNGAGKSSTIRMITYITTPDSGTVTLGGEPVGPSTQQRMGYLPEERGLYKKMKVGEQLVYLAQLKGMDTAGAEASVRKWLDRFGASDWFGKRVDELSKGMQQKVQFVSTVAHDPDLYIFDEPFSGLDPINADVLQETVLDLRDRGKTVLFASHRMEQVERLCDDLCLISQGRVVLRGTLREVKARYGRDTATVEWDGPADWVGRLADAGGVRVLSQTDGRAELRLVSAGPNDVLERAIADGAEVLQFGLHAPPLTEIFRTAVEEGVQA